MRRIASAALATFGLVAALIGVGLMTIWAPGSTVSASVSQPEAAFIRTDPGVIDLIGPEVTITAKADADADVTLAFGLSEDVAAWAEGLDVATVTGLKDWDNLDVVVGGDDAATPSASPEESAAPSPSAEDAEAPQDVDPNIAKLADSDMWIQVEQGKGEISVSYRVADTGAMSLIAASSDGKAPELTLEWERSVSNSYAMPIIVIGGLVALIGVLIFVLDSQDRRRSAGRKAARDRRVDRKASRAAAETAVLSQVSSDSAEAEESAEGRSEQDAQTGHAFGAGILPASLAAQEFRNRELSDEDRIVLDATDEGDSAGEPEGFTVNPEAGEGRLNEAALWEAVTSEQAAVGSAETDAGEAADADGAAGAEAVVAEGAEGVEAQDLAGPEDAETVDASQATGADRDVEAEGQSATEEDSDEDNTEDEENTHA